MLRARVCEIACHVLLKIYQSVFEVGIYNKWYAKLHRRKSYFEIN